MDALRETATPMNVLIVDDEKNIRRTVRMCLEGHGCRVFEASTAEEALEVSGADRLDVVLLDLKLGSQSGLDLLAPLRSQHPAAEIVLITAYGTIESAVAAMQMGATDYLTKPFTPVQLTHLVDRGRDRKTQRVRIEMLSDRLAYEAPDTLTESASPAMKSVLATLSTVATHDVSILLRGENGTGKTMLGRFLHERSRQKDGPFVVVNCPTLSDELLASELFGHARGAFTGAVRTQPGKVEAADGGTLFLDEIGEVSPGIQAKLLQFVQERTFERVGEPRLRRVDVRIIAASNRDLDADVAAGRFRQDLLFRLNTVEIAIPPLRDRREDIAGLAGRFAEFVARATGRQTPRISDECLKRLCAYDWPGNVRELRNAIERAMIFSPAGVIEPEALPGRIVERSSGVWLGGEFSLGEVEQAHIAAVIARCPTQEAAARVLGVDASTLWRKRRRQTE